jgi:D-3-phosphoglycerate dehydrogenase / 2-oxoglutarate reductase
MVSNASDQRNAANMFLFDFPYEVEMGSKEFNILIIGDRFVAHQMFKGAIETHLDAIHRKANYTVFETRWPDDPLRDVEEVHEAVGDVDAMVSQLHDIDIIVTDYGAVTKRMIESAPRLKLIAVARGGPVSVNTNVAAKRGIPVVNLPGRNSRAVAEFTLGLILSQLKRISECHADMKVGIWRGDCYRFENAPRELPGLRAGLVGFGSVGRLLAQMLQCLGMNVVAYDPFVDARIFEERQVSRVDLDTLLARSDVVSLHARVTPQNLRMMAEKQFRMMKPAAYLINTARGDLVDYRALYTALKEGRIAGAALDIYDTEPIDPHHPLLELKNVTFAPHIAGSSRETAIRSAELLAQEIVRFVRNEPLHNPVSAS